MAVTVKPAADRMIRIVIVDDHRTFAEAAAIALDSEPDIEVIGVATNPWEARELLPGADVVILDLALDAYDGLDLAEEIASVQPNTRVVIMTANHDPKMLERALSIPVAGFVLKTMAIAEVISSVRATQNSQVAIPSSLLTQLMDGRRVAEVQRGEVEQLRSHLSDRELQILQLLANGASTGQIADQLFLSVNTIRTHIQNVITKLNAHSRLEAVSYGIAKGLIAAPGREA